MYKDSRFFIWKEGRDQKGRLRLQLFYPTLVREEQDSYKVMRYGLYILAFLFLLIPILYFFLPLLVLLIYSIFPIVMGISFLSSFKGDKLESRKATHFQLIAKDGKMKFDTFVKNKLPKRLALEEIEHFSAEVIDILILADIKRIEPEKDIPIDRKVFALWLWQKKSEKPIAIIYPLKAYPHLKEQEEEDLKRLASYLNALLKNGLYPQLDATMLSPWDYISLSPAPSE